MSVSGSKKVTAGLLENISLLKTQENRTVLTTKRRLEQQEIYYMMYHVTHRGLWSSFSDQGLNVSVLQCFHKLWPVTLKSEYVKTSLVSSSCRGNPQQGTSDVGVEVYVLRQ